MSSDKTIAAANLSVGDFFEIADGVYMVTKKVYAPRWDSLATITAIKVDAEQRSFQVSRHEQLPFKGRLIKRGISDRKKSRK